MKKIILLSCLFLMASTIFAQKANETATIEKEILRLEELGRAKSLKGDTNWDDITADGAYFIDPSGNVIIYKKGQNLAAGYPPPKSLKISDIIVRVYSEIVVVTAQMDIEMETADKKIVSFSLRYMNIWKKFDDGWKLVAAERTAIRPAGK